MTAVEWLVDKLEIFATEEEMNIIEQAKEMEKEQMIDFAKMHVKIALKAVENEMILQASSVKHWYLPETIK
jgi:hypothetical protein